MDCKFKVGDKVILNNARKIGTVIKITDKRKDVIVDFGNYKETFRYDGMSKGDIWYRDRIRIIDDTVMNEIKNERLVRAAYNKLEKLKLNLTPEIAKKIIDFYEEIINE